MPKFNFSVPHTAGLEKAKKDLRAYLEKMREYAADKVSDMHEDWSKWDSDHVVDFSLKSFGMAIKGAMTVEPDKVAVNGEIPFAAMMFKGKIEEGFRDTVRKALS
ncbi:MAG: polyhydroxyalkanoic acid system family protein [Planctomycetia bacterium]|nr:polyhydroxyalkanoic acid system family protein [Planctomycetia bacterium]